MRLKGLCWLVILAFLNCFTTSQSAADLPKEVVAQVEEGLMKLFGFKGRPKLDKSKLVIPRAMLELYERQMGFPLETQSIPKPGIHARSANTVRSFTHIESPVDARFPGHHKFRLKFDLSSLPKKERIQAAELTVNREIVNWLSEITDEKDHFQRVLVSDVIRPGIKGKREPITRIIDSKKIDIRKSGTLSLDVLPAVERWIEDPTTNHGIVIIVSGMGRNKTNASRHIRLRRSADEDDNAWLPKQPLLLTYTDDGNNKQRTGKQMSQMRRRRSYKRSRKSEPCRRHSMYVDFNDVGWSDWIVAPPGYHAFYCSGECNFPLAEHMNTTNHAIVQTLMNSASPNKVPKACCVPTQLNSMSMLYLDDGRKVVLKNYKDMVVIGCGCR